MQKTFFCANAADTERLGAALGRLLAGGDNLLLSGELGAGKTTLAKGIAQGLGIAPEQITSPTFNLFNSYQGRETLRHFDLYRISDAQELALIGFASYSEEAGINIIEWGELFPTAMPKECLRISIAYKDAGRELTLLPSGPRYEKLCREVGHACSGH